MATFNDTALANDNSSGTTLSTADALAVTAGDLVYVVAKWEGADGASVTFDTGASTPTFSVACALVNSTATDLHSATAYWVATSTGTINPRMVLDSARSFRAFKAFSVTPASGKTWSLGNTASNASISGGSSNTPSSGSASATGPGVAFGTFGIYSSLTLTPGSGWTQPAEFNTASFACGEYQIVSGAGTLTADGTLSGSPHWIAMLAIFNEASAVAQNAGATPPQPGPGVSPNKTTQFSPARRASAGVQGSAVTLALTGVSATTSVGQLSAVKSYRARPRQPGPGAAGPYSNAQFIAAPRAVTIQGVPVTVALSGVSATGSPGTVVSAVAPALTAVQATGSPGTAVSAVSYGLTADTATGSVGTVTASGATSAALTGVSATGSTGTLAPAISYALTGVAATGSVGTVAAAASYAATGVLGTGTPGTVTSSIAYAATGTTGTGSVGNLGASGSGGASLTGVSATGSAGTVVAAISRALTGVSASGAVGTVTGSTGADVTRSLTGVSANVAVATLNSTLSRALSGNAAAGTVGSVTNPAEAVFTGESRGRIGAGRGSAASARVGDAQDATQGRIGPTRQ